MGIDNTGILQLMQRKCKRILSVYAEDELSGQPFYSLRKLMTMMEENEIGSLYDLDNPRKCVWDTILAFHSNRDDCLVLGIHYGWGSSQGTLGQLIIIKNFVPSSLAGTSLKVQEHL